MKFTLLRSIGHNEAGDYFVHHRGARATLDALAAYFPIRVPA